MLKLDFDVTLQPRESKQGKAYEKPWMGVYAEGGDISLQDFSLNTADAIRKVALSYLEQGKDLAAFAERLRAVQLAGETHGRGPNTQSKRLTV